MCAVYIQFMSCHAIPVHNQFGHPPPPLFGAHLHIHVHVYARLL